MSTLVAVLLGILYLVALIWLGLATLRKGHFMFFLIGIVLPVLWVVGALLPPTLRAREAARRAA